LGSEETSEPTWPLDASDRSPPRRRARRPVPWFRIVLALAAVVALVWASMSPGGLRARLSGIDSSITGTVSVLTQSRDLDRASKMFDGWYTQQGSYPDYTQSQLDALPDADWSEGMDVAWCTPRDVVLIAFTASGTVSRLLLDGAVVGDLDGRVACPADVTNPVPWKLKAAKG
jgi:hypothetical protein